MYNLLTKNILISFFLATISSVNAMEEPENFTPLSWVRKAHETKPFDYLQIAIEAAQLRAEYTRAALKILQSEALTLEQKGEFSEILNPNFKSFMSQFSINKEKNIQQLNTNLALARLPMLDSNATALEALIADQRYMLTGTLQQWEYLEKSFQSYQHSYQRNQIQDLIPFLNQLFRETLAMTIYSTGEMINQANGHDAGYLKDEINYTFCLLDNLLLHCHLVSPLNQSQIEYSTTIKTLFSKKNNRALGDYFALPICNPNTSETIDHLDTVLSEQEKNTIAETAERKVKLKQDKPLFNREESIKFWRGSHMAFLARDRNKMQYKNKIIADPLSSPVLLKHSRLFFLTPECLTFAQYIQPFESELREEKKAELAATYAALGIAPEENKKERKKQNQKKVPQKQITSQPAIEEPKQTRSKPSVAQPAPAVLPKAAPPSSLAQTNLVSRKKRQAEKKEAEREELRKIMEKKQSIVLKKQAFQEHPSDHIAIDFKQPMYPSLEELDLYDKIWQPDSQRKDLSWAILTSSLKSYGWLLSDKNGSSSVIFNPPGWFWEIKVEAPPELTIHFKPTKIMIHKARDEHQSPMPAYIIGFLHEALGNNIGLSELVVKAIKAKVSTLTHAVDDPHGKGKEK